LAQVTAMEDNHRAMGKLVLVVDDQPSILSTLSAILSDEGYRTVVSESGREALRLYEEHRPDAVLLDIWLADMDGLETLQALRDIDPGAAVIMISGHGTAATAVQALKMGACDFIEKPLSYEQVIAAVSAALTSKEASAGTGRFPTLGDDRAAPPDLAPPPPLRLLTTGTEPQRTLRSSTVLYGLGLHSGTRTGMALQPLRVDSGIHLVTLPTRTHVPAHVDSVADTDYATTLRVGGQSIRTVEHLLSALHARGVSNLLIKVHGEIPVLDGSAAEFCTMLEQVGVVDQEAPRRELVVDQRYELRQGDKLMAIEPYDGFAVSYLLRYPPPIGEQHYEFELTSFEDYREQIAPARTFGFLKDLKMMAELALGTGGRLDNCILVGEDGIVNTELRFPDEFVRHKILDVIGDLYLLGYPIRGKVTARLTGHRDNIALLRAIQAANTMASA
jgi:UDP-3-O-[3-hydroxymyristoyl] N-acetylglucosamine deacetylase